MKIILVLLPHVRVHSGSRKPRDTLKSLLRTQTLLHNPPLRLFFISVFVTEASGL